MEQVYTWIIVSEKIDYVLGLDSLKSQVQQKYTFTTYKEKGMQPVALQKA